MYLEVNYLSILCILYFRGFKSVHLFDCKFIQVLFSGNAVLALLPTLTRFLSQRAFRGPIYQLLRF